MLFSERFRNLSVLTLWRPAKNLIWFFDKSSSFKFLRRLRWGAKRQRRSASWSRCRRVVGEIRTACWAFRTWLLKSRPFWLMVRWQVVRRWVCFLSSRISRGRTTSFTIVTRCAYSTCFTSKTTVRSVSHFYSSVDRLTRIRIPLTRQLFSTGSIRSSSKLRSHLARRSSWRTSSSNRVIIINTCKVAVAVANSGNCPH